jgi:antitoxin component YwqK of YwqJK toxin-antitoxin module
MKGAYEAGELDGEWQYFDETGMLIVETEYDQGRAVRINGQKIKLPASRNEQE